MRSRLLIRKTRRPADRPPNLADYQGVRAAFSWQAARCELDGLPEGRGLNLAHEAVDRHAVGPNRQCAALRWLDRAGRVRDYTYEEMRALSNRFANVLRALGVGRGERVCALTGRLPALYVAALGTLKNGSVFCPLFAAYGPEPVHTRLAKAGATVLVTTSALYHRKVAPLLDSLPQLRHVLVVSAGITRSQKTNVHGFEETLAKASDQFTIPPTKDEDMALLHFTSGTTGMPKGAIHVHAAAIAQQSTAKFALDLRPGDVSWCTADAGWVTGTIYGILAPMMVGATVLVDEADFDGERWYRTLRDQQVTVWYTTPTAVRLLMRLGTIPIRDDPFQRLRFLATVGEPLHAEAVLWGEEAFGRPFHDNWWQTETGAIAIANFRAVDIKPGSMGKPVPGIEAAIVRRLGDGAIERLDEPNQLGELALRAGWPSMFRGYLDEAARYRACFAAGWYLTGDLARQDEDGYFWFVGRADEVIKSSGHLIGPCEVEAVLMAHPAVAEASVIGMPDAVAMEVVAAFVVANPGYQPDERLRRELLAHARERLGAAAAPKVIVFRQALPRTRSGKILRRALKTEALDSGKAHHAASDDGQ